MVGANSLYMHFARSGGALVLQQQLLFVHLAGHFRCGGVAIVVVGEKKAASNLIQQWWCSLFLCNHRVDNGDGSAAGSCWGGFEAAHWIRTEAILGTVDCLTYTVSDDQVQWSGLFSVALFLIEKICVD